WNSGTTNRSPTRTASSGSCTRFTSRMLSAASSITTTPSFQLPTPKVTTTATTDVSVRARIADEIRTRRRFVLSSHVRPDGDAIGSQVAMALALRAMGKEARMVDRDPAPPPLRVFPAVNDIEVAERIDDPGDAVIVMECGDLGRTGVAGFERGFVINIDHHIGNTNYGAL